MEEIVVGPSDHWRRVLRLVKKAAASDAPVLLTGETGTGKGVVAQLIHSKSARRHGPFTKVDLATVCPSLCESELFGFEKGAFTGADAPKAGAFELAHGGTLFLDEVGSISLSMQAKLLNVLEDRKFRRVGGTRETEVDFRLISASNGDLERMVGDSTFRSDLLFRLRVVEIRLEPLRNRPEDIPPLIKHYAESLGKKYHGRPLRVSAEAMRAFVSYPWPGNVRELRNVVERLALGLEHDVIEAAGLCGELRRQSALTLLQHSQPVTLREMERAYCQQVLESVGGNKTRAAAILGISVNTLKSKLRQ